MKFGSVAADSNRRLLQQVRWKRTVTNNIADAAQTRFAFPAGGTGNSFSVPACDFIR
jgi:hypothetical protein